MSNKFAMRMGGQNDPRYLSVDNLSKFAAEIGVGQRGLKRELAGLVEKVEAIAPGVAEEYRQQFDPPVIVGRIEKVLTQRLNKARGMW
ncbi:MAG: hypothetical protein KAG93_07310 [Desulfuromusa sp.]|nr:hypothetical protein [Desulfuromusa sp.]